MRMIPTLLLALTISATTAQASHKADFTCPARFEAISEQLRLKALEFRDNGDKDIFVYEGAEDIQELYENLSTALGQKVPYEGETTVVIRVVRFNEADNDVAYVLFMGWHGKEQCMMGSFKMPVVMWDKIKHYVEGM